MILSSQATPGAIRTSSSFQIPSLHFIVGRAEMVHPSLECGEHLPWGATAGHVACREREAPGFQLPAAASGSFLPGERLPLLQGFDVIAAPG